MACYSKSKNSVKSKKRIFIYITCNFLHKEQALEKTPSMMKIFDKVSESFLYSFPNQL